MTEFRTIGGGADGPPATTEQIAAMEFEGVKRIARMSKQDRKQSLHAMADRVYKAVQIASDFLVLDKPEAIDLVRKNYDVFGPSLMELAYSADDARALFEIIRSGEVRLAVALAVIEGDDPDPDGGDEADDGGGETVAA
jgi:hypothetical protein